jgi:hypothetical protein
MGWLGMHLSKSHVPVQMLQVDITYYIFHWDEGSEDDIGPCFIDSTAFLGLVGYLIRF